MKRSLFAELRRRNVFKAAAAYLALGWVVTQVTSTVAPPLHLPEWIVPVVVWIGVIGFPFVIMFSWIYELTPEGLKRESEVDRSASITHITSRRLEYIIISLLVLAIGLSAFERFVPRRVEPAAASREAQTPAVPSASTPSAASVAPEASDNSIAVLPFVNMSDEKSNEYFSDGITEELLNLLAKVPKLRVIARTSSFSYKGKDTPIAEIARALRVASVLEGSVRKSGEKVRITVQLIRASDSSHLWSETYDRTLDDIFKVQDDIAAAVVDKLRITLLGAVPTAKPVDPKAYPSILQAQALSDQQTAAGRTQAIALYQQALAVAPSEARAWAGWRASTSTRRSMASARRVKAGASRGGSEQGTRHRRRRRRRYGQPRAHSRGFRSRSAFGSALLPARARPRARQPGCRQQRGCPAHVHRASRRGARAVRLSHGTRPRKCHGIQQSQQCGVQRKAMGCVDRCRAYRHSPQPGGRRGAKWCRAGDAARQARCRRRAEGIRSRAGRTIAHAGRRTGPVHTRPHQ
jgi:TolB-like protein